MAAFPFYYYFSSSIVYAAVSKPQSDRGPTIKDPNLSAKIVFRGGLKFPTSMAFLGPNDILVLEKNNGTVQRIVNGVMLSKPLLDVNIANKRETGMLGIAIAKHPPNGPTYVFLSYTETKVEGSDICPKPSYCIPGHDPLGNRLYRYELIDNKLVNPKLLLDLPAVPFPTHNGGEIIIGPDNNVYFTIGDVGNKGNAYGIRNSFGIDFDPVTKKLWEDGKAIQDIIGSMNSLDKYYAYGIRNSFGIDFDPVTKKLWDTENGPSFGDEINLVEPGFNSGWRKVQGIWETNGAALGKVTLNPTGLEDFGGKGKYSAPKFVWLNTTGPTAIKFLNSDKLGKQYKNDMFVGDYHGGNIYHFKLNQNRTGLVLTGPLADKVANTPEEMQQGEIVFAKGFVAVTDLQISPYDDYLYVVSISQGKICRIVPQSN